MSYTTTNHISLDIYNNSIICVNAKQYDTNARSVEVTCTENGKKIVLVQNEVRAYIRCQKPDGYYIYNDATVLENGNIQIELTQQMLAEAGKCKVDVMLLDADGEININKDNELVLLNSSVLTTMYFYINVLSSTVNHSDIESSNEYNALLHAMRRNVALEKELQENENGIIDEKGKVIQDGRVQAEEKRVIAENIREQQEAKRIETFNKNEANRQSTFDTNEAARQKTFDDNESERSSTFTTNENQRQSTFETNEAKRQNDFETNETNRQNEFDSNESDRQSEFDTNEANRKATFEASENERKETFKSNEESRQSTFTTNEESMSTTFSTNETNRTNTFNEKINTWQEDVNGVIQECEDATNASIRAEVARSTNFTTSMNGWDTQINNAISGFESDVNEVITSCNDAEALRVSAEGARVNAENSRVTAEESRQINTDNAISACEEATSNANTAAEACQEILDTGVVLQDEKGVENGVATLDENGKIPFAQLNIQETTTTVSLSTLEWAGSETEKYHAVISDVDLTDKVVISFYITSWNNLTPNDVVQPYCDGTNIMIMANTNFENTETDITIKILYY